MLTERDGIFMVGRNSPALHHYTSKVEFVDEFGTAQPALEVHFQDGPIGEFGINGTTNEECIRMLIDRIESLNVMDGGKYRCAENLNAIDALGHALHWLEQRTWNRLSRGVEGKNIA